ncbi:GumC family protein [Amaricoccus sp. W119]|uniref:GumC family protein n=1 Tax=Amaricoccus sp. W119 TaxID=3391833 RepID=UPI0039A52D36
MDPKEMIGEIGRTARRRLPMALPVVALGTALTIAFAMTRPPSFEATAKILVESPRVAVDLARSTVTLSAPARLQLIEEQLMARENVDGLLDRMGLFDRPGLTQADRRELLREATLIQSISTATGETNPWGGGGSAGLFAFTISVTLDDAEKAAAIANEFAAEAVTRNRLVRADQAEDTLAYFRSEDDRLAAALDAKEAEIAAFKEAYAGALPESLEARRGTLGRLREDLLEIDRRTMELEEKLADLGAAAAGVRPLDGATTVDPAEARLRELELALISKQGRLAPNHPEIRSLREEIAAVRALVAPRAAGARTGAADGPLAERRAAIENQNAQITSQIERLTTQAGEMTAQAEALEASIRATPRIAIEFDALSRSLTELQTLRTDVTRRYAEARTGAELEASERSERFQIVEPAEVPELPIGPDRKKIAALGLAASIALAGGLAMLLEFLNTAPRSSAAMERQLGLRPVVAIPYVHAPGERSRRRLRLLAAIALLVLGVGAVDRIVLPLGPTVTRLATAAGLGALLPGTAEADAPPKL